MVHNFDDVGAVVVDMGACNVRAGYAGDDTPRIFESSWVGFEPTSSSSIPGCCPIPLETCSPTMARSTLSRFEPRPSLRYDLVSRKHELDKEVVEHLFRYLFNSGRGFPCGIDTSQTPLLFTEPTSSRGGNISIRKAMMELAFEKYNFVATQSIRKSSASAFSMGKSTGMVVDIGASSLTVSPVFDGFTLLKSCLEYPVGGYLLDACIEQLIALKCSNSIEAPTSSSSMSSLASRRSLTRRFKECHCRTSDAPIPAAAFATWSSSVSGSGSVSFPTQPAAADHHHINLFTLPDGQLIDVSLFSSVIPELLFESYPLVSNPLPRLPQDIGGYQGLSTAVIDCISTVDVDIRKLVASELILVGGSTLFPGFVERFHKTICSMDTCPLFSVKTKITASPSSVDRMSSSWLGGSIVASLSSFQELWLSRQQFQEQGIDRLISDNYSKYANF